MHIEQLIHIQYFTGQVSILSRNRAKSVPSVSI